MRKKPELKHEARAGDRVSKTFEASKTNMSNIATVLKAEISRIARKEIRAETESLKTQSTHYRSQIAALKRQLADLGSYGQRSTQQIR